MDREQIRNYLPHREPMLLLDTLSVQSDRRARASVAIRGDEWFLQGHFPGNPVVPGVIQCEMLAQACSALILSELKGHTPYFTGMDKVRFRRKVLPGDVMHIRCELLENRAPFYFAQAQGYIDD